MISLPYDPTRPLTELLLDNPHARQSIIKALDLVDSDEYRQIVRNVINNIDNYPSQRSLRSALNVERDIMNVFYIMKNIENGNVLFEFAYVNVYQLPVFKIMIIPIDDDTYEIHFDFTMEADILPLSNSLRNYLEETVREVRFRKDSMFALLYYIFKYKRPDIIYLQRGITVRDSVNVRTDSTGYQYVRWNDYARFYPDEREASELNNKQINGFFKRIYRKYNEKKILRTIYAYNKEAIELISSRTQ